MIWRVGEGCVRFILMNGSIEPVGVGSTSAAFGFTGP